MWPVPVHSWATEARLQASVGPLGGEGEQEERQRDGEGGRAAGSANLAPSPAPGQGWMGPLPVAAVDGCLGCTLNKGIQPKAQIEAEIQLRIPLQDHVPCGLEGSSLPGLSSSPPHPKISLTCFTLTEASLRIGWSEVLPCGTPVELGAEQRCTLHRG